ncbi:MAG: glycosyltransferase [Candidatus Eremiobacteraeota bacterium]|nr:glycosyltransferase [Candidatus Eremiobacteraeota bacterium]
MTALQPVARCSPSIYFNETDWAEEAAAARALDVSDDVLVVGIDFADPAAGLAEMLDARRRGRTIALLPVFRDPFELWMLKIGASIVTTADPERRYEQLAALRTGTLKVENHTFEELSAIPQDTKNAIWLGLRLADIVLIGSVTERARWNAILGRVIRRFAVLPAAGLNAAAAPKPSPSVTVYAPSTSRVLLGLTELALADRGIRAQFITAENRHEPIRAHVVIVPEWWRALRVRALSERGHNVIVPDISAPEELDGRIFSYAQLDVRRLGSALDLAWSMPAQGPRAEISSTLVVAQIESTRAPQPRPGRISIVIRTFDRPALLRRAIASVVRQTHDDVEVVVVNNGGDDIRSLVEDAVGGRPYRYERSEDRRHIGVASNIGARAASGAYVGYLDDDDLLYPDHCVRAIDALACSGADLAYTTCVAEYAQIDNGVKTVLGAQIFIDRDFNRDEIFVGNLAPIHSIVHSRNLFDRYGYFDETLPVTDDWEFWLRATSRNARWVRVDRATCEYSWRHDPQCGNMTIGYQQQFADCYEIITKRYAQFTAHRPSLLASQAASLAAQRNRARMAADPGNAAQTVMSSMLASAARVGPLIDPIAW